MKLLRYYDASTPRPGLLDESAVVRDTTSLVSDYKPDTLLPALKALATCDPSSLPQVATVSELRLAPPISAPSKIVGVAKNYKDHAKEMGGDPPPEPTIFLKAPSAVTGPNDHIELPPDSRKTDWEVELGVVIGALAKSITQDRAHEHIAGYTIINDISERHFQKERAGQFTKGKSYDTFAPLGPYLVTPDEVPDPHDLRLFTEIDGISRQDGTSQDMIFKIPFLVSYISQFMTLLPGDIIATGTPAGVGAGHNPPVFLQAGQSVKAGIEGLGEQSLSAR
ncbi:MAG: fumarylacetoacetate hydrolase family protein [Planctomycetota bacterium]